MSDPKPSAAELVEVFLRMGKAGHYTTALLEDIVFAARAEAVAPVLEVLRQLVAAMYRCDGSDDRTTCGALAVREEDGRVYCDRHGRFDDGEEAPDLPFAAPLRAALALLDAHDKETP